MDPLTLFALANGAVAAVKQGCALYKEIQSAASDVKGVLADLEEQFTSRHKDKAPTVAEKNQYIAEKNRVIELSKKQPDDVFTQIGEHLGTYFENMATCMAIFDEEEKRAQQVYTGTDSIGKRALQRVLMRSRLDAMQVELREIMVYQCPKELGDLYTRTEKMMERIKKEQAIAIKKQMEKDHIAGIKRAKKLRKIKAIAACYGAWIFCILYFIALMWSSYEIRKADRPDLGTCFIAKGMPGYKFYSNLKWVDCEH